MTITYSAARSYVGNIPARLSATAGAIGVSLPLLYHAVCPCHALPAATMLAPVLGGAAGGTITAVAQWPRTQVALHLAERRGEEIYCKPASYEPINNPVRGRMLVNRALAEQQPQSLEHACTDYHFSEETLSDANALVNGASYAMMVGSIAYIGLSSNGRRRTKRGDSCACS